MWLMYLLGIGSLFGAAWLGHRFSAAKPAEIALVLRTFVAVTGALAGTGLLVAGRVGMAIIVVIAATVAFRTLRASRRGADRWNAGPASGSGGMSTVETELLRMSLDRDSGEVSGTVKSGAFAGAELMGLAIGDLLALRDEAARRDPESVALLEGFLDRYHPDWRARTTEGNAAAADDAGEMSEAVALEVLGLTKGADEAAIKSAHRRLMASYHPDRGGSTFLASQINRAKDVLLGRRASG